MASRTLVTMALPYANGSIHLGHLVEAVQTDVYVRALRAMKKDVLFICADDQHGTPIEVNAAKAGVAPERFVEQFWLSHQRDYAAFDISFDEFYKTHSPENERQAVRIFEALRANGHIEKRDVEQLYCEIDQRFLPDRFVKGGCPKCGTLDQYGDACEKCGSTYEPTDLKSPSCAICLEQGRGQVTPVRRSSPHYFVRLADFQQFLRAWTAEPGHLQPEVLRSLEKWLSEPLKDWDVSRDAPYFGFKIPGEESKYFYVWLDAPVGYLSSTEHWAGKHGRRVEEWWGRDADAEIIHFIGKDIVYFHTLFWPAMLHASGWKVPAHVHVHGMLTVEGAKMSKSRGTFINASEYIDAGLEPEWLRYFYASNLGAAPSDIDLSMKELQNRVNGELLNNVGNLANRALNILAKNFEGRFKYWADLDASAVLKQADDTIEAVFAEYARFDTRAAIQRVLALSSAGNELLQREQPWKLLKTNPLLAQQWCTLAVALARVCGRLLAPVVPLYALGLAGQTGAPLDKAIEEWIANGRATDVKPLVRKVEDADVEKLASRFTPAPGAAASTAPATTALAKSEPPPRADAPLNADAPPKDAPPKTGAAPAEISIDQFAAVDLRAGLVLAAERVPKADKLLRLTIDLGEGAPRTIVSGVAASYQPEELVGKMVAVVANLGKKTLRGVESHGMVLFATGGTRGLTAVQLPADVAPGSKVK